MVARADRNLLVEVLLAHILCGLCENCAKGLSFSLSEIFYTYTSSWESKKPLMSLT